MCSYFVDSVNELLKVKEELSRERDDLLADVVKLREQVAEAQVKQQQQDQQQQEMISKIQEVGIAGVKVTVSVRVRVWARGR